jgi:hypothetical protein
MEQNADDPSAIAHLAMIDLDDGRLESARQRVRHGVNISVGSGMSEAAANMLVDLGRGEALYGVGSAATQTLVAFHKHATMTARRTLNIYAI